MKRTIYLIISILLASCGQAVVDNDVPDGMPRLLGLNDAQINLYQEFNPLAGVSAEDDEDGDISANIVVTGYVNNAVEDEYILFYSVKDSGGNIAEDQRHVQVVKAESIAPRLIGVDEVTLSQGDSFEFRAGISAVDETDGDISDHIVVQGNFNNTIPGVYELKYSVSDSSGNTAEAMRLIHVLPAGTTAPVFSGTGDLQILQYSEFNPRLGVSAIDDVDGDVTSQIELLGEVDTRLPGKYSLTYFVKDRAGNLRTQLRIVQVDPLDQVVPVIDGATDKIVLQYTIFDPWLGVRVNDNVDGDLQHKTQLTGSVNTQLPGVYLLTYRVQDAAGNTSSVDRRVVVKAVDSILPVFQGVAPLSVMQNQAFNALAGVSAMDNVDGDITSNVVVTGSVNVSEVGIYNVTYRVKDSSGNEAIVDRRVEVVLLDTHAPVFTGVNNVSIKRGVQFNRLLGVTALDDVDGDVSAKIQIVGEVDANTVGVYSLEYTVADAAGNSVKSMRLVEVIERDIIAPVISGVGDARVFIGGTFDPYAGVSVSDNMDGDISGKLQVTGGFSLNTVGMYPLTYIVSDKAGNVASVMRVLYVEAADTIAPQFFGLGTAYAFKNEPFDARLGVIAIDDVDGDISEKIEVLGEVDTGWLGIFILNYRVQDSSGNQVFASRVVRVVERDVNPPVLIGVGDVVLFQNYYFNPLQGVTAIDESDGDLTAAIVVVGEVDSRVVGEYQLDYSVKDSSGNIVVAKRKVKVVLPDNTAPAFSGIKNQTIEKGSGFDPLEGVAAFDEVDGDVTSKIVVSGSVDVTVLGSYVLSYRVSDAAGNVTLAANKITVVPRDEIAPVITGVSSVTVEEGGSFDALSGVSAVDDRDGDITPSIVVTGSVNRAVPGDYVLTYSVSDAAGNVAVRDRTVTVREKDRVSPVFSGVADTIVLQSSVFNPLAGVGAIDDRDGDVRAKIVVNGSVDTAIAGSYTLQYSVSDSAGNEARETRVVVVEELDLVAPVIVGADDVLIAKDASFDVRAGVSASDNIDGDISNKIVVQGVVNTAVPGSYPVSYKVQDVAANLVTVSRIVTVNAPPKFDSLMGNIRVQPESSVSLSIAATDSNGDVVSYSVSNLPSWLSYDAQTLLITGTVTAQQLGVTEQFTVAANDALNTTVMAVELRVANPPPPASDAHRLLVQSTFGPTPELLAEVQAVGIEAWIDAQLNMGSAYDSAADNWKTHLERTIEIAQQSQPGKKWFGSGAFNRYVASEFVADYQMSSWWENVLGASKAGYDQVGSDQLRQRVAYALSQLLVTSAFPAPLNQRAEAMAYYYDLLAKNAFGNYRNLMGDIARSPAMGVYLSHQGNAKADLVKGTRPDENFAREVMQLFTIGLYKMNLDGSPDRDGNPATYPDAGSVVVQSYQQTDVEELAKVMTGWDLVNNGVFFGYLFVKEGDYTQQMEFNPRYHEDEVAEGGDGLVTVLGEAIALNSGADGSGMDAALDVLFNHQNTAPFVSRSLIQRLVTSNPSSAYVARVASVFENNGQGVRGDLKAVVRAILLDQEARSTTAQQGFGKAKEPIMAFAQLLRATHVSPLNGWKSPENVQMSDVYWYPSAELHLGQAPMRSQSVFNFYQPGFVPVDAEFQQNSWAMPETQIQSGVVLVEYGNLVHSMLSNYEENKITKLDKTTVAAFALNKNSYKTNGLFLTSFSDDLVLFEQALEGDSNGDFASMSSTVVDADGDTPKANAIDAVLDRIDAVLLGGRMTPEVRGALKHYLLDATGTNTANNVENALTIIRDAYHLVSISSLYMIQK